MSKTKFSVQRHFLDISWGSQKTNNTDQKSCWFCWHVIRCFYFCYLENFIRISGFIKIWYDFGVTKKISGKWAMNCRKKIRSGKEYKIWINSMDFLENGWAWESECLHGWFSECLHGHAGLQVEFLNYFWVMNLC